VRITTVHFHSPFTHSPFATCQGDFNDANIVLNEDCTEVAGVIDFGDAVHTLMVNDLAIAMAYSCVSSFGKQHPVEAAAAVYAGYLSVASLTAEERSLVCTLTACRLAISYTLGMFSYAQDPTNQYLLFHAGAVVHLQ
jgi:Ser/Thr protein kinase RdoA (MazF antagonist)